MVLETKRRNQAKKKKVQEGNDQEMAQSERNSHSTNRRVDLRFLPKTTNTSFFSFIKSNINKPTFGVLKVSVDNILNTLQEFVLPRDSCSKIHPLSLEFAVSAFALHKKTKCSENLSFFSCCPQRHLD